MISARQWWIGLAAFLVISAALFYILVSAGGQAPKSLPPLAPSSIYDEHLDDLDRQAVDEAYRKHIQLMFDALIRDPIGQPFRSLAGHRNARRAYVDVMTGIAKRDERPKK